MEEAQRLGNYILGSKTKSEFYDEFAGKFSVGFDPHLHLQRVGVVNQTTMLATETQAIADFIKQLIITKFGAENLKNILLIRATPCVTPPTIIRILLINYSKQKPTLLW